MLLLFPAVVVELLLAPPCACGCCVLLQKFTMCLWVLCSAKADDQLGATLLFLLCCFYFTYLRTDTTLAL